MVKHKIIMILHKDQKYFFNKEKLKVEIILAHTQNHNNNLIHKIATD